MIVKPRKVEPGWLTRWSKDAFLLMSRAWILWIGVAGAIAACGHCLHSPDFGLFVWPLARLSVATWALAVFAPGTYLRRISGDVRGR